MKKILIISAFLGMFAVILGAFGAHGLRGYIPDASLESYKTGVQYQFIHVLAIVGIFSIYSRYPLPLFKTVGWLFLIGIILFSGSLYLLTTSSMWTSSSVSFLGPITPLGGLFFIAGWLVFIIGLTKIKA
ncbi:MAG TPA: DUF423 domain-containing protein [Saprospiraceae bacterium]|nr:DUF423 domain-containing protein [Saprospiraceae bacterium]HQW54657.1 DUF423 domain-containing protein [Saprospiraceae bacterium]